MSRGVVYIGVGDEYIREAKYAARSLRNKNEDIPIALIADQKVDCHPFDTVVEAEYTEGWMVKIGNMQKTPYDKTLYLDTDTYIADDISDVFDLLDRFDVAVSQKPNHFDREEFPLDIPRSFPSVQAGVIAFKDNERIRRFFDEWETAYVEGNKRMHDQFHLRKTLYENDLHVAALPREYNCTFGSVGQVSGTVKIFHGRPLNQLYSEISKHKGKEITPTRRELMSEIVKKINKTDLPRVYYPTEEGVEIRAQDSDFQLYHSNIHQAPLTLNRLISSIRRNGLKTTAVRGIKEVLQAVKRALNQ